MVDSDGVEAYINSLEWRLAMWKLLGSVTMVAALALAGSAFACDMHQSASAGGQSVASSTTTPPTGTTTTTPKTTPSNTGG
jgi:hypothetical protein